MTDEQRRSEILKAEEVIRALAKELGRQSETVTRLDCATNTLNESRSAILQATNVVQQGVVAVEGSRTTLREAGEALHQTGKRLDSEFASVLKSVAATLVPIDAKIDTAISNQRSAADDLISEMNTSNERLGKLEELSAIQGQKVESIAEIQSRNGSFVRRGVVCSIALNIVVVLILLFKLFAKP